MSKSQRKYQALILAIYSFIMLYIISRGIFTKFVHPRMLIFTLISAIIILILSLVDVNKYNEYNRKKLNISNIIYILPLILILFINNGEYINLQNSTNNLYSYANKQSANNVSNQTSSNNRNTTSSNIGDTIVNNIDYSSKVDTSKIDYVLDDKNYLDIMTLVEQDDTDKYKGKTISFNGYINRDSTMAKNQFSVGRMAIWCCIADAYYSGFLCDLKDNTAYQNNDWVQVTGVIDKIQVTDPSANNMTYTTPYIHVVKIEKISKPNDEYVYAR